MFESSGYTHPGAQQLIKNWKAEAIVRLGRERTDDVSFSNPNKSDSDSRNHYLSCAVMHVRRTISTTIQFWNAMFVIAAIAPSDFEICVSL